MFLVGLENSLAEFSAIVNRLMSFPDTLLSLMPFRPVSSRREKEGAGMLRHWRQLKRCSQYSNFWCESKSVICLDCFENQSHSQRGGFLWSRCTEGRSISRRTIDTNSIQVPNESLVHWDLIITNVKHITRLHQYHQYYSQQIPPSKVPKHRQ